MGRRAAGRTTVDWWTPLPIIRALGQFDLDPCGAPGHPTATTTYVLPDDGLAHEWEGRVWMNPPYGKAMPLWLSRFTKHRMGTALVFARTGTAWFQRLAAGASEILFLSGRVHFIRKGIEPSRAPTPSALIAYGPYDAWALSRSNLPGLYIAGHLPQGHFPPRVIGSTHG